MSHTRLDELSHIEQAFFVNAAEHDILACVFGDLDEAEQALPPAQLAEILLGLIDQGWLEVRRYVSWTTPDGKRGYIPGDVIDRGKLRSVLADSSTWDYERCFLDWQGALILTFTESGLKSQHGSD